MEEYSPERAEAILGDTIDKCMEITGNRIMEEMNNLFGDLKRSMQG